MEESDNVSIESFSTLNSIDESTDNKLINNESVNKELANNESNNNESNNNESNNNESNNNEPNNKEPNGNEPIVNETADNNDKQINLNENQQSKTKLIYNLLFGDKWILKLNWNFRGELIKLFDEYIRLLVSNKEILIDEKELIKKNKNDLIKLLNKSPLKLNEESNSYEICISLDNILKHQIIDQLIKNEDLIIDYKDKIDANLKNKLIEENNYLIAKLVNLPIQYSNNDVNLIEDKEFKSSQSKDEKSINKFEIELSNLKNETIDLKEEINKLKHNLIDEKFKNEFYNNSSTLKERIIELNKIFSENNSIRLYYLKKNMKKFFKNPYIIYSEPITFLNIQWFIQIYSKYNENDKKKYLEFFLRAKNEIDDNNNVKWRCMTSFELIMKNNLPNKQDKIIELNYTFNKSLGYGCPMFSSEEELFNLENGFIKDDSIRFEVNLKVYQTERNI